MIYATLGTSRQAMSQYQSRQRAWQQVLEQAERQLVDHRRHHPGLGLKKAYHQIQPQGLGRRRFVEEMTYRGYALPRKRNEQRTTRATGFRFPNLIIGLIINGINLIWQSDTTYFRLGDRFYYLTFILDVYSRRIVGYCVSDHLRADANVAALKMAFRTRNGQDLSQLIFHSDGGSQYHCRLFVELLGQRGISSSMGTTATDNAYAEKLNDIIKNEYLAYYHINDLAQLKRLVKRAVDNYNQTRIHGQLPHHCSPLDFEHYLCQDQGQRPWLLMRHAQAPREGWQVNAGQNLTYPGIWAPKGVSQILPAHVHLHQPMRDPQLVLDLGMGIF